MDFAGSWVPMDLMNTLFILWIVSIEVVFTMAVYLNHRRRGKKVDPLASLRQGRKKGRQSRRRM